MALTSNSSISQTFVECLLCADLCASTTERIIEMKHGPQSPEVLPKSLSLCQLQLYISICWMFQTVFPTSICSNFTLSKPKLIDFVRQTYTIHLSNSFFHFHSILCNKYLLITCYVPDSKLGTHWEYGVKTDTFPVEDLPI